MAKTDRERQEAKRDKRLEYMRMQIATADRREALSVGDRSAKSRFLSPRTSTCPLGVLTFA